MRFSASSLALLAVPFLMTMLAVPARAETHPKAGPLVAQAPTAQSAAPSSTPSTAQSGQPASPEGSAESTPSQSSSDSVAGDSKAAAGPPKSSILINIDKSSQEMTVFIDGIEQYRWPVSTGLRGYSTPSGSYQARSMNKIWYSKQWDNAPMPHAIFFTKEGHAIHGTTEVKRLGTAASHGCVRLLPKNAETLFGLVAQNGLENTQVTLVGTTPGGEAKVASQGPRRMPQDYPPPWFEPGAPFYMQPGPQKRRGLFGRRWFQPAPQGYYAPRGYPRAVGPRGY
jgi:lipoprotein-anchoring transpeptidase ErfK/SrfK